LKALPLLAYAFAVIMLGTTAPTPLYALYASRMGFSVLTTTFVYAAYASGVLFALLVFGRWSDAMGRRPVLIAGAVFAIASAAVFLSADSVPTLLLGRILSGLSAGVFTGTATAAVIEAAPPRWRTQAAAVATVANIGGLGVGPLLAGLLVQYAAWPLHLIFIVLIVLTALAAVAVLIVPETSARTGTMTVQRLSIPPEVRSVFALASTAAFAGFAVTGLFTAVTPSFLSGVVGIDNHALAGGIVCSIFTASALAQLVATRIPTRCAMALGCGLLAIGMAILAIGLHFSSLTGLIAAAVVAGVGQGISFSRGLAAIVELTPTNRRAEVSSAYFVVAYLALSVPVVGEGLAAQAWGLRTAGVGFAVGVSVLAIACLAAIVLQGDASADPARDPAPHAPRESH
jgi:MFS family permease